MRGRYVARKGGWDCHGLPVEVEVERELGLSGKTQIREFGIEEFNRRCRESVQRYVSEWEALTERMGMWLDTAGAYWTLTNGYIETVWWLVRQMWDKGLLYEGFNFVPVDGDANAWRVVVADFVTTEDGSGIVHLAPAFGEVDREVGDAEGLPTLNPVDAAARFESVVEPWAGLFVKDADPGIIQALRAAGRLEKVEPYEHSYPHCWRCGTPLVYYAKTSW